MTAPANCRLIGRGWIVEADPGDRHDLDLIGPAMLVNDGHGKIALAPLEADLDLE